MKVGVCTFADGCANIWNIVCQGVVYLFILSRLQNILKMFTSYFHVLWMCPHTHQNVKKNSFSSSLTWGKKLKENQYEVNKKSWKKSVFNEVRDIQLKARNFHGSSLSLREKTWAKFFPSAGQHLPPSHLRDQR